MGRLLSWLIILWVLGTLAFVGAKVFLDVRSPPVAQRELPSGKPAEEGNVSGRITDALDRALQTSKTETGAGEEQTAGGAEPGIPDLASPTSPPAAEAPSTEDASPNGEEKTVTKDDYGAMDEIERDLAPGAGSEAPAPEPGLSESSPTPQPKRAAPPPPPTAGASQPKDQPATTSAQKPSEIQRVTVYYGTDRTLETRDNVAVYGSVPSDKLDYGSVEVTLPPVHQRGVLERPAWWRFEFTTDPQKHVVFQSFSRLKEDKFFTDIHALVNKSKRKEAFVFIHGFNTSFDEAAMRTAQLSYDLNFDGAPIFYSWSSRGELDPLAYVADGNAADQTVPQLAKFLDLVAKRTGAERIHVIAHSMGNRALVQALADLERKAPVGANRRPFHQIVLAAPDIDRKVFMRLSQQIQKEADNITLYASSNDAALKAALKFNGFPRAGDATGGVVVVPGITSIDASAVATELFSFGHNFFADTRSVLDDIRALMVTGGLPETRGLHPVKAGDTVYWRIN